MKDLLDLQLLAEYVETFYGYGTYAGQYWFVGIEEGGAETVEDNAARIIKWNRLGRPELEELILTDWRKTQKTWGRLIRILLAATSTEAYGAGASITPQAVLDYQRHSLGRADGGTCLVELLPLPSKSIGHWMWEELQGLPHLHTRKAYQEHYSHNRAAHIAARIREHKPSVVVFYGFTWSYRQWWHRIAGVGFDEVNMEHGSFYIANNGHTVFAIVQHPAYRPARNDYFHLVGRAIAARLTNIHNSDGRPHG